MLDTPIAVQLGEFVARLRFEELPPAVVDKGKAPINYSVTGGLACSNAPRVSSALDAAPSADDLVRLTLA